LCVDSMGDPEAAKQHYKKALELDGKLVEASVNLSAIYLDGKDSASALPVIKQGLAADPQNAMLLQNHAIALDDLGKVEEADKAYAAALKSKPDDGVRLMYARLLVRAKKKDAAIEQLKQVVSSSQDTAALADATFLYGKLEAYDQCIVSADKAAKIKADAGIYIRRGLCKHELKDEPGAAKDFELAIGADPKSAAAHYYLGHALVAKSKAKAIQEWTKAVELDPNGQYGKDAKEAIAKAKKGK
jgi:tetratricopeptide (TPR) repeat protein